MSSRQKHRKELDCRLIVGHQLTQPAQQEVGSGLEITVFAPNCLRDSLRRDLDHKSGVLYFDLSSSADHEAQLYLEGGSRILIELLH